MMVGGPNDSIKQLKPFLDVLAPPADPEHGPGWGHMGPTGRGPLREDGPQRGRVRDDAGLRRGLRAVRRVASSSSTTRRSRTCGCRARWCARGCASWPRARSSRRATSSPTIAPLCRRLGRGPLDGRGGDRPARADARHHDIAVRALLLARQKALRGQGQRRPAQPVRRPRHQEVGRQVTATVAENPLIEGLERQPVHPTTLVDLRRHGRPVQAQAAAGDLQPRPRGSAAGDVHPRRLLALGHARTTTSATWRSTRSTSSRAASPTRRCSTRCSSTCATCPGRSTTRASTSKLDETLDEFDERGRRADQPRVLPVDRARRSSRSSSRRSARPGWTSTARPRCACIIEKPFGTTLAEAKELNRHVLVGASTSSRSSASTTTSARRPSRTCWRSGSPTPCSSRSGTGTTSTTSRSPRPRTSASARAPGYYDSAGALRDLVQNHMLQLLCHLAMEPPVTSPPTRCATRRSRCCTRSRRRPRTRSRAWPCARSTPTGTVGGEERRGLPRREDVPAGLQHRDLRGAAAVGRQLALGGRAVLPAHRQAAGAQGHGDRGDAQAGPAPRLPAGGLDRRAAQPADPHRCSPTRACRWRSRRRSPARGCASAR